MVGGTLTDWINENIFPGVIWCAKRLSGNDTLANGSHQAGLYLPKEIIFEILPDLNKPKQVNPSIKIKTRVNLWPKYIEIKAVWYNNKIFGGTRNEVRLTRFGGKDSPVLDPESTGAIALFAFQKKRNSEDLFCDIWVCKDFCEEEEIEKIIGDVDPGNFVVWPNNGGFEKINKSGEKCCLHYEKIPKDWFKNFPSGMEIILKIIGERKFTDSEPDLRLINRRACEFRLFKCLEDSVELPRIKGGFSSIDEFIGVAQTILQRRKTRAGTSLELHTFQIFLEENLEEGVNFDYQAESEDGKRPDFIFPNAKAYCDQSFPESKLRMLALKTTCRDRWRQVLNEADRIKRKHLLTLQEGISLNQFQEMCNANIQLVIPRPLLEKFPKEIHGSLQTLEAFIQETRKICSSR